MKNQNAAPKVVVEDATIVSFDPRQRVGKVRTAGGEIIAISMHTCHQIKRDDKGPFFTHQPCKRWPKAEEKIKLVKSTKVIGSAHRWGYALYWELPAAKAPAEAVAEQPAPVETSDKPVAKSSNGNGNGNAQTAPVALKIATPPVPQRRSRVARMFGIVTPLDVELGALPKDELEFLSREAGGRNGGTRAYHKQALARV